MWVLLLEKMLALTDLHQCQQPMSDSQQPYGQHMNFDPVQGMAHQEKQLLPPLPPHQHDALIWAWLLMSVHHPQYAQLPDNLKLHQHNHELVGRHCGPRSTPWRGTLLMHSGGLLALRRYRVVVLLADSEAEAEAVAVADLLTLPTSDLQPAWCQWRSLQWKHITGAGYTKQC